MLDTTEATPEASFTYPDPAKAPTVYPSVVRYVGICPITNGVPEGCIQVAVPTISIRTLPVIGFTLIGIGVFPSTEDTHRRVNRPFAS